MKRLEQAEILLQIKLFYDSIWLLYMWGILRDKHNTTKGIMIQGMKWEEIKMNKRYIGWDLRNEWGIGILKTNYGEILAAMTSQNIEILPSSLLWILR